MSIFISVTKESAVLFVGMEDPLSSPSVMNEEKKDEGARETMEDERKWRKLEKKDKETNNMIVER